MIKRTLYLLWISFLALQCNQPTEGCRDVQATNYDVTADEDCEMSCCVYPTLTLQISPKIRQVIDNVDTIIAFSYDKQYALPDNLADTFSVQRIRAYLSDFRLISTIGDTHKISDTKTIELATGENVTLSDDFFLFDAGSSSYELGTFNEQDIYDKVKFNVGLYSELKGVNPDETMINRLKKIAPDSLNYDDTYGYIAQRYVIFAPHTAVDSTVLSVFNPQEIELPITPITFKSGYDGTLKMTMRYDKLFENVSFATLNVSDTTNIVMNLANAITVDTLTQN